MSWLNQTSSCSFPLRLGRRLCSRKELAVSFIQYGLVQWLVGKGWLLLVTVC